MMLKIILTICFAITLSVSSAQAQGQSGAGGGLVTEGNLKSIISKIDEFLKTNEGKTAFPEIVNYDRSHPAEESFHQVAKNTHPVVHQQEVRDQYGIVRDCVSPFGKGIQRRFECDARKLPEWSVENEPQFFIIVFHELLVQTQIEKPMSRYIPSIYTVSHRILAHTHFNKNSNKWGLGTAGLSGDSAFLKNGTCSALNVRYQISRKTMNDARGAISALSRSRILKEKGRIFPVRRAEREVIYQESFGKKDGAEIRIQLKAEGAKGLRGTEYYDYILGFSEESIHREALRLAEAEYFPLDAVMKRSNCSTVLELIELNAPTLVSKGAQNQLGACQVKALSDSRYVVTVHGKVHPLEGYTYSSIDEISAALKGALDGRLCF